MSVAFDRGWRETGIVAALILITLGATAWLRPLMLPDEGRYVGVAWEMMRSGDWLTPTLNGLPFFHKPPLFYWLTAASMSLFGLNDWAARAAPLLGAWLGAFSLFVFTRRWVDIRAARLTLVALLAQPLFYLGGQFANLDMLVAGCITATIVLLAHASLCVERKLPFRRTLAGAYAMAAAGILAKGLIGAVIPALVIGTWLLVMRRWRTLLALLWWPAALLFLSLSGPWFLAMQVRFPDFLDYFFVVQHFKRFVAGGFNNVQPFWFYPAVLLLFSLPWLGWVYAIFKRRGESDSEQRSIRLLMWLWLAMVVLFFSIPQSKLLGYVLPAMPPLAFLFADGFRALGAPSNRIRRLWWASVGITSIASIVAIVGFTIHPRHSSLHLASALRAQRSEGQPVFMLDNYYYDVPFYARIVEPIKIVDNWSDPGIRDRDNWRKELADAGAFNVAGADASLIRPSSLPSELCSFPSAWIIGRTERAVDYPFLAHGQVAFSENGTTLWKLDSSRPPLFKALACEGGTSAS